MDSGKKQFSIMGMIRHARVVLDALTNDDPDRVSASNIALLRLKLKESFNAAALYPQEMGRAQFLFFGDTNHGDSRLHDYFYSQVNMERMSAAGVKHIFPEIIPAQQERVRAMARGEIGPKEALALFMDEELKKAKALQNAQVLALLSDPRMSAFLLQKMTKLCDRFQRAHEHGMAIHCLDDRKNLSAEAMQSILGFMGAINLEIFKKYGISKPLHGKLMIKTVIENRAKLKGLEAKMESADMNGFLDARKKDDRSLAERMMEVARGEKGATLFGAGHAKEADGLFDTLGQDRTLRVDLYASRDTYADRLFHQIMRRGIQPHYYHLLDEDRLVRVRDFAGAQPKP